MGQRVWVRGLAGTAGSGAAVGSSDGRISPEGGTTMTLHYTGHLGSGLRHLPIDHHGIGDLPAQALLLRPGAQTPGDGRLVVSAGPEPSLLVLERRGQEQNEGGVGTAAAHLTRSLEVDLQQDVPSRTRLGDRGPVEVAQELGPLEETALFRIGLERGPIDEDIGVLRLSRAPDTGCP